MKLHLSDLKALQASKNWKRFVYLSENQPGYTCLNPLKISMTFHRMEVFSAPPSASICFMDAGDYLCLDSIASVTCKPDILGDLLKISCKGGEKYIVIAQ